MELEELFTPPKQYVARYTGNAPAIDGLLDDSMWQRAEWTETFVDIEGDKMPRPTYRTRVKMLWNDSCLFLGAYLEEPHVWATLKNHDDIVFQDNDFEVFIDPQNNTHQYFEIEINALNTVFDLFMPKPYRNGSGAIHAFDIHRLQTAVKVQGTLDKADDRDTGWSIEMAIPFRQLSSGNRWKAPKEDALWRINFSRVQWDVDIRDGKYSRKRDEKGKLLPEHNWVWSPQGVINMHFPERWGYLRLTRTASNDSFRLPYNERRKPYLWLVYYRQKQYIKKHGRYAGSLGDLGMTVLEVPVDNQPNKLVLEATSRQFTVYITDNTSALSVNDEGLVQTVNIPW